MTDVNEIKVINESKEVTDEQVEQIQKVVDETLGGKREKLGNPVVESITLVDGEVDCRQLSDGDMKQIIVRLNKNLADGFNTLIDSVNYLTLVTLESLSPSKRDEVLKRLDQLRVKGEQINHQ